MTKRESLIEGPDERKGKKMIDIKGLDKAKVLQALYDAAKVQGMGYLQYVPGPLSYTEAQEALSRSTYFDYFKGRVMKVDLSGDSFNPRLYDRDNGQGMAKAAVNSIR